ncbi:MAG: isoprenylcysteine carboxylmethyltransferase family protein [Bdellovibrionota bacterium]
MKIIYIFVGSYFLLTIQPEVKTFEHSLTSVKSTSIDKGSFLLITLLAYFNMLGVYYYSVISGKIDTISGLETFGAIFVGVVGLLFRFWSIYCLGEFFSVQVRIKSDQKIVDEGPYKIIRHPSYLGSLIFFVSISLIFNLYLLALLSAILWMAVYFYRIKVEEAELQNFFGELYLEYKKNTWALIPYIF